MCSYYYGFFVQRKTVPVEGKLKEFTENRSITLSYLKLISDSSYISSPLYPISHYILLSFPLKLLSLLLFLSHAFHMAVFLIKTPI